MSKLHVTKFEETKQAPILVLLHGWGSSSKIWQLCLNDLCKNFQVWCIDLPGHGENHSIAWDESVEQGLSLLANTLPENCSIVGWSLGGLCAQLFLQRFPHRVNNLMLIASTPKFIASKNWPNGMSAETLKKFSLNFKHSPQQAIKQFHILQTLHGASSKKIMHSLEYAAMHQPLKNITWGLRWLNNIDLRSSDNAQHAHIHIMQGEKDQVSSMHAAEDTAKIWDNVSLHKIVDAGHVPFLSHPKVFIENVKLMMQEN